MRGYRFLRVHIVPYFHVFCSVWAGAFYLMQTCNSKNTILFYLLTSRQFVLKKQDYILTGSDSSNSVTSPQPRRKYFNPSIVGVYLSGGKKYSFFGRFDVFCFLETSVLRFALLPYYRRYFRKTQFLSQNKNAMTQKPRPLFTQINSRIFFTVNIPKYWRVLK